MSESTQNACLCGEECTCECCKNDLDCCKTGKCKEVNGCCTDSNCCKEGSRCSAAPKEAKSNE